MYLGGRQDPDAAQFTLGAPPQAYNSVAEITVENDVLGMIIP
jgi:hypothetical protein